MTFRETCDLQSHPLDEPIAVIRLVNDEAKHAHHRVVDVTISAEDRGVMVSMCSSGERCLFTWENTQIIPYLGKGK